MQLAQLKHKSYKNELLFVSNGKYTKIKQSKTKKIINTCEPNLSLFATGSGIFGGNSTRVLLECCQVYSAPTRCFQSG